MNRRSFLARTAATAVLLTGTSTLWRLARPTPANAENFEVVKSDAEWHQVLNDAQYSVFA
jgi:hypothetical protein